MKIHRIPQPQLALAVAILTFVSLAASLKGIEPWAENPWYWSVDGQPVLLLGGSDDDNLFQWPEQKLIPQLDRITAAGGNFVRNTMSDRKDAGFEVYPFLQLENGKYDLSQWNPEYWQRFEQFLAETSQRKIFTQIEVWDRFDYTDNRDSDPRRWEQHPYNPQNNVNYTYEETGFAKRYPEHPGANKQPFFFSTPKQRNIEPLLQVQEAFVHRMLDATLKYDHVLYCIDNETRAEPQWAEHWTKLIRERSGQAGKTVAITEMWDDWDLTAQRHRQTFDRPGFYDFVDVSQNNHNSGEKHWKNFMFVRQYLSQQPRPMNTTKTYGADGNKFGHSDQDAIERFWRHLLGGAAAVRFHRPDSGLGINDRAVACIRAARRMTAGIPMWNLTPANELLADRSENEAYAAATSNRSTIVLFFPAGQERGVTLTDGTSDASWEVTWIDIDQGNVHSVASRLSGKIEPPADGNMAAVLKRVDRPMLSGELLEVEGHAGFVFLPEKNLRSKPQPWVMYAPTLLPNYPDEHERWMHEQLIAAGIAVAGVDVGEAYGSPSGTQVLNALYHKLTSERNFASQPVLLGRSRGGLWAINWAATNVERVAGFAGIYPAMDLRSYPGLRRAAGAYQLTEQELQENLAQLNPIAQAPILARHAVPAYIIHGAQDSVVPIDENSLAFQSAYRAAGKADALTLNVISDQGHNYWPGFFRSQELVDFIIKRAVSH